MHGHHGIILAGIVGAIAFAFGKRTAQVIVGGALLLGAAFFVYIGWRIVMGTI